MNWRRVLAGVVAAVAVATTGLVVLAVAVLHSAGPSVDRGTSHVCRPDAPRDPVVLSWTEDIDNVFAAGQNFAPPKLEVMADGRVIADAVRVSILSPAQLSALEKRLLDDFAHTSRFSPLFLSRQDGHDEQGREEITIWPQGRPVTGGVVIYNPDQSPDRPKPLLPYWLAQPLDAGLPPSWRDAVDQLSALSRSTLSDGRLYDSTDIRVMISDDQNFLSGVSEGQLTLSSSVRPWPGGVPHVPPYQPSDGSGWGLQNRVVSGSDAQAVRLAFTRYLDWPAIAAVYDNGLPGRLPAWYGIWRPMTPTEMSSSVVPVVCGSSPQAHTPSSATEVTPLRLTEHGT